MLILIDSIKDTEFNDSFFQTIVNIISEFVDFKCDSELSVVLTDNKNIHGLNMQYRGKDAPTDVLSFPMNDDYMLGDIVISLDIAAQQALERDISLSREVAYLFIHGFLHLLGFDHEDVAGNELTNDAEEMYSLQEEILAKWVHQNEC